MSTTEARKAQALHEAGDRGYYIRNSKTRIVVAGPYREQATAQREASARNREVPLAPDPLEVVLVGREEGVLWP